jgi:GH24 family phage-related lysozyme (muramidase)
MEHKFDEGVKEVLATLSIFGGIVTGSHIWDKLESRPESDKEKVKALTIAKAKSNNTSFDDAVNQVLQQYGAPVEQQQAVKVKPNIKRQAVKVKPNRFYDINDGPKGARDSTPDTVVDDNLVDMVKTFEGFHPKRYWDVKQWSIGHGSKWAGQKSVSKDEAHQLLAKRLNSDRKKVIAYGKKHGYNWNSHQIDALTSFVYNLGSGKLSKLTANGKRDNNTIAKKMLLYKKAKEKKGWVTLKGLERRRNAESQLFRHGYGAET